MSDIIERFCCAICRRSLARAIQRADAPPSKNHTPKTVRFFFPSAVMSATRHSIELPSRQSSELRLHATSPATGRSRRRAPRMGFRAARRAAPLHRARCRHRPRWEDRRPICLVRLAARIVADTATQYSPRPFSDRGARSVDSLEVRIRCPPDSKQRRHHAALACAASGLSGSHYDQIALPGECLVLNSATQM